MSFSEDDTKSRQIIPRWYTFHTARLLGDVAPLRAQQLPKDLVKSAIARRERDWVDLKQLTYAIDLIGTAIALNDFSSPHLSEAVNFVLKNKDIASGLATELAEKLLNRGNTPTDQDNQSHLFTDKSQFYHWIGQLKKDVRDYPLNSIKWAELAFFYSVIGQNHAAEHAMGAAMAFTHENRYILRSAARFYLHRGDPEEAIFHLRRSQLLNVDPWIMASEIAICDAFNIRSKILKHGRN